MKNIPKLFIGFIVLKSLANKFKHMLCQLCHHVFFNWKLIQTFDVLSIWNLNMFSKLRFTFTNFHSCLNSWRSYKRSTCLLQILFYTLESHRFQPNICQFSCLRILEKYSSPIYLVYRILDTLLSWLSCNLIISAHYLRSTRWFLPVNFKTGYDATNFMIFMPEWYR